MTYYHAAPPSPPIPADAPPARRWPKRLLITFLIVANLGVFGGLGFVWFKARQGLNQVATISVEGLTEAGGLGEPRTILLVGSDSRQDLPEDWVGYGDYGGQRADVIILVQVLHGICYAFFFATVYVFVDAYFPRDARASAQGLFMMMTNGFGAFLGSRISGIVIDKYFILEGGAFDWKGIWFTFAGYALVVAILFAIFFKHKHVPEEMAKISH